MYILIIFLTLGIGFVFLQILFKLFPYSGFQGLVSYLILLLNGVVGGVMINSILYSNYGLVIKIITIACILILAFFIQILTYPQDVGSTVISKITSSLKAIKNQDDIEIDKFTKYNRQEQIVYSAKYNSDYSREYYTLWSNQSEEKYQIVNQNGILKYNPNKIEIDVASSPNKIFILDKSGNKTHYGIESFSKLINLGNGSLKNWSIKKYNSNYVGYELILYNRIKK